MPTKGKKSSKKKVKLNTLSKSRKDLGKGDMKKLKGGILPYIEQDNITGHANLGDIKVNFQKG